MKSLLLALPLLLALTIPAKAQASNEATIYVYRNLYHTTFGKAAPTVSVNDVKYAVLDEGRYFIAHVPVGLVVVRTGRKKENRVDVDARKGETYYMRVRAHPGSFLTRFEMFRVTKEEFESDMKERELRYVEAKDIKSEKVSPRP